jgi:uncharacterized membrane-anchored protein
LEYRHSSEKKAEEFMEKLNNKLILEKTQEENIEIIFNKKSIKKINQYYFKIVIK